METMKKFCKNQKEAEKFQNRLYTIYDSVKLVRFPDVLGIAGLYVWKVGKKVV